MFTLDECDLICKEIITLCDEVPDKAIDFAEEVREKTESINNWVHTNLRVTDKQMIALKNMKSGLERWIN